MYVCLCHGLNDRHVRAAIDEGGAGSAAEVYRHYACKPQCGKCVSTVHDMVRAAAPIQARAATSRRGCGRCGDDCDCAGA